MKAGSRARAALPALEKLLDDREPSTRAAAVMAILAVEETGIGMGRRMMGNDGATRSRRAMTGSGKPSPRVLAGPARDDRGQGFAPGLAQ